MDEFDEINRFMRKGAYSNVIDRLVTQRGRIHADFRADLNHAWYLAGSAAYDAGQLDKALKFFKNSARSWPADTQALMAAANCYSDLNKPRLAARYLEKAIAIEPGNPGLYFNLANSLFDIGKHEEAAALYRKVLKMSKGETRKRAVKNLGHVLDRMTKSASGKVD